MINLNELQLPNAYEANHYFASTNLTLYPFSVFFFNQLEEVTFKDITIFYGNNGSSKTTLLKVINDKLQNIDKSYYNDSIELDSLYLLDEPENCLSPQLQLKLVDLILETVRYYSCQFIIATHSPLILSLHNALIYDLDSSPVITKNFEELTNVKIYYEFFMKHKDKFK